MQLPMARGPLSTGVIETLAGRGGPGVDVLLRRVREMPLDADVLTDEDLHLALWVLYELHYGGFDGVDSDLEWDPGLLRLRAALEKPFEAELRRRALPHVEAHVEPHVQAASFGPDDLAELLFELTAGFEGPSVSKFLHREATSEQLAEFLIHRSIYQLKESDPYSWVIPRITGKPKAALVELLYDEYGGGRAERLHATMFGDSLESAGLDRTYGAYLDRVPGYTLANNNAMSLFGLHRRLRGAAVGHLGAYEATSSIPCRKYAGAVRRLGLPEVVAEYFDEHVEADAVHEQLAFRDICAQLATTRQVEAGEVVFGAAACLVMEAIVGERMLEAWQAGRSTLRGGPVDLTAPSTLEAVAS
jgi:hypothetical protein